MHGSFCGELPAPRTRTSKAPAKALAKRIAERGMTTRLGGATRGTTTTPLDMDAEGSPSYIACHGDVGTPTSVRIVVVLAGGELVAARAAVALLG